MAAPQTPSSLPTDSHGLWRETLGIVFGQPLSVRNSSTVEARRSLTKDSLPLRRNLTTPSHSEHRDTVVTPTRLPTDASPSLVPVGQIEDVVPPKYVGVDNFATATEHEQDTALSSSSYAAPKYHDADTLDRWDALVEQLDNAEIRYKLSAETDSDGYWKHSYYRDAQGSRPLVHYCTTLEQSERCAALFLNETVLGLDLEWASHLVSTKTASNQASLIQIASQSHIALFHVSLHSGDSTQMIAPTLRNIIQSPRIVKTGVHIAADCKRLNRWYEIQACGLMELSHLHKLVKHSQAEPDKVNRKLVALAKLAEEHMHMPLDKGEVRTSDWSKRLDYNQIMYAANDAYVGLHLFHVLNQKRLALKQTPPMPFFAETGRKIRVAPTEIQMPADLEDLKLESDDDIMETIETNVETTRKDQAKVAPGKTKTSSKGTKQSHEVIPKAVPSSTDAQETKEMLRNAETWIVEHETVRDAASNKSVKAKANRSHLKAYWLWHHKLKTPEEIGELMNIKMATVRVYILSAIHHDLLPFESSRLRTIGEKTYFAPGPIKYSKVVGQYLA